MKKNYCTLLVALASLVMVQAQDNNPPPAQPADASATVAAVTNAVAATTETATAATNAVAATADPAVATATNAAENADVTAAAAAVGAPAATSPDAIIPKIQFSDVPIRTAIDNLARLAGINYMLDPKIGYGQPDANGQIKPEPTLSIRWENITAGDALLALLDNYGLQLIRDKSTGISRITLKDPSAPPPLFTKVIQLKYAGVDTIVDSIKSVLTDKRSKVLPDARTSQLVVVATDPEQQAVDTLITQLDKPTRQVLIETRLAQISSNPSTTKGVDWTGTLQGQNIKFGNNAVAGVLGNPGLLASTASGFTPNTFFLNADGLSAVLSFLNSSSDAKVISTPRIVTLDNETADINVTRTFPIFQVTAGTANTTGGSSVTYSNVGTILHVTPRITANDYIWMSVIPEVSSFFGNFSATIGGQTYQAPQFDTRKIKTEVMVPNSNTLVLGGLVQDNPQDQYTKVPLLGDIPGLGFFFRSESKKISKDNLLIFITPTIVQDSDFHPAKSNFLNSKIPAFKDTMDPSSSWDGAQKAGQWVNPGAMSQD